MNNWQVQKHLRSMYEQMGVEELSEREDVATKFTHAVTGQTFCEIAAEHLAIGVKRNPRDMARVKRIVGNFIGLAEAMLKYFPDDVDFKSIAEWGASLTPREPNRYVAEMCSKLTGPRVDPFLHRAEKLAGRIPIPDGDGNPAEAHLRVERIDALASLMALFAVPDAYAACPVVNERST